MTINDRCHQVYTWHVNVSEECTRGMKTSVSLWYIVEWRIIHSEELVKLVASLKRSKATSGSKGLLHQV